MTAHFAAIDIVLLAAYFGVTLVVGFWKRQRNTDDYLIADRQLGLPVFVATLVATWYGGILAVGEFTYESGLANWTTQALPYYLFAILFALFLAPRVRSASLYTIPDKLAQEYDRKTALLGSLLAFVLASPAPYILMVGQLLAVAFGWPLVPAMVVGTLFSIVYVYVGGFQSDVRINVFQFCLMFAGFASALWVVASGAGGFHWLAAHLPKDHLRLDGGLGAPYILVWFFIAFWTLVDPGFHQRCYAAKSPAVARNGILIAVLCWAVFDFLTTSTGLYAKAIMPNLAPGTEGMAYPLLAERMLPAGVKGLFYVAMLATVMSTLVSYTFLAAMTIGRDLVWRLRGEVGNANVPLYTRWGMVAAAMLGIIGSALLPSAVSQWYTIGTVCVPGLLFPVVTGYVARWKVSAGFAFGSMLAGTGISLGWLSAGWIRHGVSPTAIYPLELQPMYPGLLAAALVYLAGRISRRAHRFVHPGGASDEPA
jgi:SSS family solute:Na+ symporter